MFWILLALRMCIILKSANKLLITAIKNQATGHYILNGKGGDVRSKKFIDMGLKWDYTVENNIETLHTDGPLPEALVVMVTQLIMLMILQLLHTMWFWAILLHTFDPWMLILKYSTSLISISQWSAANDACLNLNIKFNYMYPKKRMVQTWTG